MMKSLLFLLLALPCFSQAPAIQWQKEYGGTAEDYGRGITQLADGGYIVTGHTYSSNGDVTGYHGFEDIFIAKINANGTLAWKKCLGGSGNEEGYCVTKTADGGFILAGLTASTDGDVGISNCNGDYWVVKMTAAGIIQWQQIYGGAGSTDRAVSIINTSDGGYAVLGEATTNSGQVTGNHGGFDLWVVKITSAGVFQWQKSYGSNQHDTASSIAQTPDGGFILSGTTNAVTGTSGDVTGNHNGAQDIWVVKISSTGVLQWQRCYGGSYLETAGTVKPTSDGNYIVVGIVESSNGDVTGLHGYNSDMWVIKIDPAGGIIWQRCLGGTGKDGGFDIYQTADGGYVASGFSGSFDGDVTGNPGQGDRAFWIVKLNWAGVLQWQRFGSSYGAATAYHIEPSADGGYIVAGTASDSSYPNQPVLGEENFYVVKLMPDTLGVAGFDTQAAALYPNPASDTFTLQLPNGTIPDRVTLTDLAGKTLIEENNTDTVGIENLAAGTYLVQVFLGDRSFIKKLVKK